MGAIELVEKLSRKHGIKFSFDLPDPLENGYLLGTFCPKDQSIHLTKDPSINTIFHEVSHYLQHKKRDPYFRILSTSSKLSVLLGLLLVLFGSPAYAWSFTSIGYLLSVSSFLFVIDEKLNGENRANKYAYAETQKLWKKEAEEEKRVC